MFGSTSGSGWGQQNNNQQQQPGAFGQPAPTTGFGAFGGGGGAFGQTQPATGAFGASAAATTPAFGGGGGFGQTQNKPGFGASTGAFGSTGATSGGFGGFGATGGTGAFGAQPAAAGGGGLFGSSGQASTSTFGSAPAGGLFGARPAATAGFGTSTALVPAVANGTASPAYEVTQERDNVGAQSVVLHYQSISCMPAYKNSSFEELRVQDYAQGRKTAGGFGQGAAFGTQPQQPQQGGSIFGGTFGQPAAAANPTPAFGSTFGSTPAATGAFGQPAAGTSTFGQPAVGAFGSTQPAQPGSSLFGGGAGGSTFGQPAAGTQTGGFGAFGQAQNKPATGFGFGAGATTQPTSTFGGGAFGQPAQQPAAGTFGQPAGQTSGFGAFGANNNQPKPGLFGSASTTTPAFGAAAQPQDQNKPAGGLFGSFGQPAATPAPAFGQQPAQPTGLFGQPAATTTPSLFGQAQGQQQPATGFGGGSLFGAKPAATTTATPSLFGGFGQQNQQNQAGTNPLMPQSTTPGLFGSTTAQPAQPAAGGFGGSLFGAKPAGTTPSLFQSQQPAATGQPSLFGGSTSTTLPGATSSIFGSSVLGGQQQQPSLVASIDQPVNHALPVFSLLPPGPRAIPAGSGGGSIVGTPSPNKKPSYFADLPTRSPVPRLGTSTYTPPGAGKLRGFASSSSGTLSGSVSNLNISGSPSRASTASPFGSSGSLGAIVRHPTLSSMSSMGPEAFASSSSSLNLSGGRRSVKKLVLDKKPGSPGPCLSASPSKNSPSKVTFNPSAGARERERERERVASATSHSIPEPVLEPEPAPQEFAAQSNLADGYWIRPSLAALERATGPIDGLTIGRSGVGSVTFLVPVNLNECPPVSELAGKTVLLTPKECTVYPDEDDKPVEGTGLNVRARIALEGCWAVDKANRQPIKQESHPKHVSHLRKLREMPDTKFIGFEMKSGTWTFTVEHFSKYGLGEDSDEEGDEEEEEGMDVENSPLKDRVVRHAPPPRAAEKAKDAGPKANPRAVPWNVRVGVEAEKVHTMQASLFRVPEARAAAAADASPKPGLFAPRKSTGTGPAVEEVQPRTSRSSLKASVNNPFVSSTAAPSTALFKPQALVSASASTAATTTRVKFTRPKTVRSTGSGAEANVFDAGLAMGRSFRVSWGPGGRLVGAGRLAKASESSIREPGLKSVVSVRRMPLASGDEASSPENVQKLVRLQFTHSTVQVDGDDVPVAFPNDDLRFRHFAGLFAPELRSNEALLWRLLVALFDEIPIRLPEGTERAVVEKITAVCRRQALSDWLEVAVSAAVDAEVQSSAAVQRIFAHLSGNQIARAVEEASKTGNVHLATLIAQHGSDPKLSADIHVQLEHWREQHAAAQMDPKLLRVYALLAGVLDVLPGSRSSDPLESSVDIAVTGSLDWRRAFGLRLWYGSSATTHDAGLALDEYEEFFTATKTALPIRGGERDAAYELIQAALRPEIPLDAALIPKTFAGNALDYRMVWHIYVVLSRVLKQRDFADRQPVEEELFGETAGLSPTANLVTSAYALQLESAGLYSEAVFVLLHLESVNGRRQAIKDLLSRNYTRLTESQLQELDQLLIPEAWLREAKAALLVSQGKVYEAFHAFIEANQQQLAYELAVDKLVPDAVLREDLELLRNIFSQFDPETVDGWSTNGKLFVDYIEMMEAQPSYELTQAAQQLLAAIPGATADKEDKRDTRWAACRARMISNLLEVTGRCGMRYSDRGEIGLIDDSSRAKHVSSLAYDSFISVLG
ncbi:hypothetical protein AURDEDRAFT_149853 [Auricularia subglabra TFB-10046 SS5]|nr:hypothetical protein AURDEDRAFT_149853 [Auricularia subglabra TFB-10046 SS5]